MLMFLLGAFPLSCMVQHLKKFSSNEIISNIGKEKSFVDEPFKETVAGRQVHDF